MEDGPRVFGSNGERKQREQEAQEAELYEQIGRLKMEREWLKGKSSALGDERRRMVDVPDPTLRTHCSRRLVKAALRGCLESSGDPKPKREITHIFHERREPLEGLSEKRQVAGIG